MHITELRTVKEWICNFHLIICQVRLSPKAVGWTHVVCTQQFAHNRPWDTSARACIQPYTWLFETGDALLENLCQSSGSGKEIKKIYEKKKVVDVLIGVEAPGSEGGNCMVSLCCVDGELRMMRRRFHGSAAVFFLNRHIPLSPAWGETNTGSSYEGEFPCIYLSCAEKQQSPD